MTANAAAPAAAGTAIAIATMAAIVARGVRRRRLTGMMFPSIARRKARWTDVLAAAGHPAPAAARRQERLA